MNMVRVIRGLRVLPSLSACLALAALVGCGGDSSKASVSGKVTYKGAPVTGGTITLTPATGNTYPIPIKPDGTFSVPDAPIGQMAVAIETDSVGGAAGMTGGMQPPKDAAPQPPKDADPSKYSTPKKVTIPAKYKVSGTSGLTWEIKAGKNPPKDFDLTD